MYVLPNVAYIRTNRWKHFDITWGNRMIKFQTTPTNLRHYTFKGHNGVQAIQLTASPASRHNHLLCRFIGNEMILFHDAVDGLWIGGSCLTPSFLRRKRNVKMMIIVIVFRKERRNHSEVCLSYTRAKDDKNIFWACFPQHGRAHFQNKKWSIAYLYVQKFYPNVTVSNFYFIFCAFVNTWQDIKKMKSMIFICSFSDFEIRVIVFAMPNSVQWSQTKLDTYSCLNVGINRHPFLAIFLCPSAMSGLLCFLSFRLIFLFTISYITLIS